MRLPGSSTANSKSPRRDCRMSPGLQWFLDSYIPWQMFTLNNEGLYSACSRALLGHLAACRSHYLRFLAWMPHALRRITQEECGSRLLALQAGESWASGYQSTTMFLECQTLPNWVNAPSLRSLSQKPLPVSNSASRDLLLSRRTAFNSLRVSR